MTFTIHASKNGETNEMHLSSPVLVVAKARMLENSGWQVHVVDSKGKEFLPPEFDHILRSDPAS